MFFFLFSIDWRLLEGITIVISLYILYHGMTLTKIQEEKMDSS